MHLMLTLRTSDCSRSMAVPKACRFDRAPRLPMITAQLKFDTWDTQRHRIALPSILISSSYRRFLSKSGDLISSVDCFPVTPHSMRPAVSIPISSSNTPPKPVPCPGSPEFGGGRDLIFVRSVSASARALDRWLKERSAARPSQSINNCALDIAMYGVVHLGHLLGKLELVVVEERGVGDDNDGDTDANSVEDRASTCVHALSKKSRVKSGRPMYRRGR